MEKQGALGFEITELRLGLPGASLNSNEKKRVFSEMAGDEDYKGPTGERNKVGPAPAYKNQVVGWPPVCSYRKRNSFNEKDRAVAGASALPKVYVKVSMDGAVYLRKIDLSMQKGYSDLAHALEKLFDCYGSIGVEALNELEGVEYMLIYEDKDGDWMLVGDVPWEMFLESCKRLRIMKRSEARDFESLQTRNFLKSSFMKDIED